MATATEAPNPKSVVHIIPFSSGVAVGAATSPPPAAKYVVLRMNEVDGYEKAIPKSAAGLAAAAAVGDDFAGKSRKASKISIAVASWRLCGPLYNTDRTFSAQALIVLASDWKPELWKHLQDILGADKVQAPLSAA